LEYAAVKLSLVFWHVLLITAGLAILPTTVFAVFVALLGFLAPLVNERPADYFINGLLVAALNVVWAVVVYLSHLRITAIRAAVAPTTRGGKKGIGE